MISTCILTILKRNYEQLAVLRHSKALSRYKLLWEKRGDREKNQLDAYYIPIVTDFLKFFCYMSVSINPKEQILLEKQFKY